MTLDPLILLIDLLAVWRLTRLVTKDDFPPIKHLRDWILRRWPSDDAEFAPDEVEVDMPDEPQDWRQFGKIVGTTTRVEWNGLAWVAVDGHWFGKLISCLWCASVWIAAGVVALRYFVEPFWQWPALLLALAGAAALIAAKVDS